MTRKLSVGLVSTLGMLAGCSPSAAPPFDADRSVAAWTDAWNTRDLDTVDSLFLNGPSATYFSSERQGLIRGYDAIKKHHEGFGFVPGGAPTGDELWLDDLEVNSYGTTAVVAGIWYFGDRSGDPTQVQKGPMSAVYVLDGAHYKIAHMHFGTYLDQ